MIILLDSDKISAYDLTKNKLVNKLLFVFII